MIHTSSTRRSFHVALGTLLLAAVAGTGCSSDDSGTGGGLGAKSGGGTGGTISLTGGSNGSGATIGVGGSSSGGSAASQSSGGSGGGCVGTSAVGMKGEAAVVMLLVDTSLSMNQNARGDNQTKLAATKQALVQAVGNLPAELNIGLIFYPGPGAQTGANNQMCMDKLTAVPIAPLNQAQAQRLTQAINGANAGGATPTHDAYVYALDQLKASTAEGQKFLVLITDGSPTYALGCMGTGMPDSPAPTQPLVDEATKAFSQDDIKTFVVGSPGSDNPDARPALSAMARGGGTGPAGCRDTGGPYCHFDMTAATNVSAALLQALGQISQQIPANCNFTIPPNPMGGTIDVNQVNVAYTVNGSEHQVGKDPSGDCSTDGWYFDDPNAPSEVILCPSLCDDVQADASASVSIEFGCETRVAGPVT